MEEAERGGDGEADPAAAPTSEPPPPPVTVYVYTYRDHMTGEQEALISRAKQGFRICKGLTVFFQQVAVIEDNYGTALIKVGERFTGLQETCAPSLSAAVACLCSSIQTLGRQHTLLASSLNQEIIKGLKLFSEQQKETVRKLGLDIQSITDEAQRARATHRKAQDKYRRCLKDAEAVIKLIGEYKEGSSNTDAQASLSCSSSSSTSGGLQAVPPKAELHRADSLFSKWLGGSMARAQDRAQELRAAQEDSLAAHKLLEAKEAEMKQRLGEQLERFEANEEARGRFIKDTLKKIQSCRQAMLERVERAVKNLLAAADQIDPEADLCEYIEQMESSPAGLTQEGVGDMEAEDARLLKATPAALTHIDRSIKNLRGLCHLFSELAAVEESYGKAYTKLLNGSGYRQDARTSPSTVNWAKTSFKEVVDAEGGTFAAAISAYMHNDRSMARLHTATASRIAQSVCVILSQLQDELTQARQNLGAGHTAAVKAYQTASRVALLKARVKGGAKVGEEGKVNASNGNYHTETKSSVATTEQGSEHGAMVPTLEEQRENLASELEALQVELRKREDERLGRMKVALMELYQALNMEYLCCVQEEERTRAMVDAIDVRADVMAFIRSTIEVEDRASNAAQPTIPDIVQQEGKALLSQLESLVKLVTGEESGDTSGSGSGGAGKAGPGRSVGSGGVLARRARSLDSASIIVDDTSTSDLIGRSRRGSRGGSVASIDLSFGADDGEDDDDDTGQGTSLEDKMEEKGGEQEEVPTPPRSPVKPSLRRDESGETRVRQVLPDLTSPRVFLDTQDQPLPSREREAGLMDLSKSVGAVQGSDMPLSSVASTQAPTTASSDALSSTGRSVDPILEISTSAPFSYATSNRGGTPPFGLRRRPKSQSSPPPPTTERILTQSPPLEDEPETAEELKEFNLPPSERVVESYSCAYMPTQLLVFHGRMFVTGNYVCFASWGSTRVCLEIDQIDSMERANTMGFVPNAISMCMKSGDKYFFSSFMYREHCYELLCKSLQTRPRTPSPLGSEEEHQGNAVERLGVEGQPSGGGERDAPTVSSGGHAASSSATPLVDRLPPGPDTTLAKMTTLADEEMACGVEEFMTLFWEEGSSFYDVLHDRSYLQKRGDLSVEVGAWVSRDASDTYSGDVFKWVRDLTYQRNRAGEAMGPKMVLTRECQMFRYEAHKEDRAVLTTVLNFTGVPYCEYFHVCTRWVVTHVGPPSPSSSSSHCRLQIGLDVVFRQSIMLRAAIKSGTEGETKRMIMDWLTKARQVVYAKTGNNAPPLLLTTAGSASTASENTSGSTNTEPSAISPPPADLICQGCPFCQLRRAYQGSPLLVQVVAALRLVGQAILSALGQAFGGMGALTGRDFLMALLTLAILLIAWLLHSCVKQMVIVAAFLNDMQSEHLKLAQAHQ